LRHHYWPGDMRRSGRSTAEFDKRVLLRPQRDARTDLSEQIDAMHEED
jgi:hypothetical protein